MNNLSEFQQAALNAIGVTNGFGLFEPTEYAISQGHERVILPIKEAREMWTVYQEQGLDELFYYHTENEPVFVYGWVPNGVQQNFASWAVEKETGGLSDKNAYYERTYEEMSKKGLDFFYLDVEMGEPVPHIPSAPRQGAGERRICK